MADETWPGDWLRGVLGVCVLAVLAKGPTYGYAISASLEEAGLGTIKGGTLYPLLGRLEDAGWLTVEWRPGDGGPGRKYYALTAAGERHARDQAERWDAFTHTTAGIIDAFASRTEEVG